MANEKTFLVSEEELNEGLNDKMPKSGNTSSVGENSFGLGNYARASGDYSVNLSSARITGGATGYGSAVLGTATAGSNKCVANAIGKGSMVLGGGNAYGEKSSMIGAGSLLNKAYGTRSVVIANGKESTALYKDELVIGEYNNPHYDVDIEDSTYCDFYANGSETSFTIYADYIVENIISVSVANTTLSESDYTISEDNHTITLNNAPDRNAIVKITYKGTSPNTQGNILTVGGSLDYSNPFNALEVKKDGSVVVGKSLTINENLEFANGEIDIGSHGIYRRYQDEPWRYNIEIGCGNRVDGMYTTHYKRNIMVGQDNSLIGGSWLVNNVVIGIGNEARGNSSTVIGQNNVAYKDYQVVLGVCNIPEDDKLFILGNGNYYYPDGAPSPSRSNAHTIDFSGNAWFAGDVEATKSDGTKVSLIDLYAKVEELEAMIQNILR